MAWLIREFGWFGVDWNIIKHTAVALTYHHRLKNAGHPVRSAIHKLRYPMEDLLNRVIEDSVKGSPTPPDFEGPQIADDTKLG
jgi:hypothetical protein